MALTANRNPAARRGHNNGVRENVAEMSVRVGGVDGQVVWSLRRTTHALGYEAGAVHEAVHGETYSGRFARVYGCIKAIAYEGRRKGFQGRNEKHGRQIKGGNWSPIDNNAPEARTNKPKEPSENQREGRVGGWVLREKLIITSSNCSAVRLGPRLARVACRASSVAA